MDVFLILLTSIVAGVLMNRLCRRRGVARWARWFCTFSAWFLVFVVGAAMVAPAIDSPSRTHLAVAVGGSSSPTAARHAGPSSSRTAGASQILKTLDDGGQSGLETTASNGTYAPPRYTAITAESRLAAGNYIARVDAEIQRGVAAFPTIDVRIAGNFSRQFDALAAEGMAQFGRLGEPLGFCTLAGAQAQQLWLSKLVVHDPTPMDIKLAKDNARAYLEYRARCLALIKA